MARTPLWIPAFLSLLVGAGIAQAEKKPQSAEPPAKALIAEIPWEGDEDNRIWVDLAPEGNARPFRLILDTGAQASVLTPGAARAQGVRVRRTKDSPYRRKTRLGKDLLFYVDSSSGDFASDIGWEYALFGGDQLYPYVFELDFESQIVRFYKSRKYRLPRKVWSTPTEAVLKMRVTANRPFLDIELEGQKLQVLVDTGAPGTLMVSEEQLKKRGISTASLLPFRSIGTTRGKMKQTFFEAKSVKIGPFELKDVPVLVAPRGFYNIGGNTDSVIGYDLLRQFIARFDYDSGRLWLKKREGVPLTFWGVDYSATQKTGAVLAHRGSGYQVVHVFEGTPAASLGVRANDRVSDSVPGEGPLLDRVSQAILEDGELTVKRKRDGAWGEVDLLASPEPEVASSPKGE
jgi:clan AA aspartic protease (TIGR02281 family)